MRIRFNFTEEQLVEMEVLYANGYGTAVIASRYGCTCGAIWWRLKSRGVVMRDRKVHSPPQISRHNHGYLMVGRKYEHRRVAEEKIGRPLRRGEVVHHLNGVTDDNRPENLVVVGSNAEHIARYHSGPKRRAKGRGDRYQEEKA